MSNGKRNHQNVESSPQILGRAAQAVNSELRDNRPQVLAPGRGKHIHSCESSYRNTVNTWSSSSGSGGRENIYKSVLGKSMNIMFNVSRLLPEGSVSVRVWETKTRDIRTLFEFVPVTENLTLVCVSGPAGGSHRWRGDSLDVTGRNTNTSEWFCSEQKSTWNCSIFIRWCDKEEEV